jgi:hypothetical protein
MGLELAITQKQAQCHADIFGGGRDLITPTVFIVNLNAKTSSEATESKALLPK